MGVVLSLKPILKTWQLCLSFKLDVQRHLQVKEIYHELLSASLILLYIYLITYNIIDCIILIKSIIINKVDYNNLYKYSVHIYILCMIKVSLHSHFWVQLSAENPFLPPYKTGNSCDFFSKSESGSTLYVGMAYIANFQIMFLLTQLLKAP